MKLNITVDGKTYEVEVEVAETAAANLPPAYPMGSARLTGSAQPPPIAPREPAGADKVCRSPVSGIVVSVCATPGDVIAVGDSLLVLEAMKMETNITAPLAGTIAAIRVQAGENVHTGDVLVEFA